MSTPGLVPNDSISRLVRAALEADTQDVDIDRLQSRICQQLAQEGRSLAAPSLAAAAANIFRQSAIRASLVAATLLIVAGLAAYFFVSTSPVQAYALVQSAQSVLQTSADHEYRVTFDDNDPMPFLGAVDEALLWTRGDRYRVIFRRGDKTIHWGQDEKKRLWIVSASNKVLSFEPDEIPREVAALLSYFSLDISRVTDQVLQNCDLSFAEDMHKQRSGIKTVHATPRADRGQVEFSTADLRIDVATKVIRGLQLTRRINGTEQGRCQFTFVGDQPQTEESYRLNAHLRPGDQVLGKSQYYDRMVELFRVIGEFSAN